MKGYFQVYTGDSHETAPERGLCLRAAGAGLNALIVQFLKKGDETAVKSLERFADHVTVEQFGQARSLDDPPAADDIAEARKGLERIRQAVCDGRYDLVVIDQGNAAVRRGLFSAEDLLEIARNRPSSVELVVTGAGADPSVIEAADLVTEMVQVKHELKRGPHAGTGI